MTTAQDQQSRAEADQWKCGNEFLPYHPSASHVEPAYRDGWNACFKAAAQVQAMGRVPPAVKKSYAHDFRPHAEYPWFCADCGYAPHDTLHSQAPRPPAAQDVPSYLAQMFGPGPALRPPAAQERAYICPTRTVADLVNNLLLMDQALPIYGAQYIEHPAGKRRAIAVPPTVSRERVKDGRWIGEGEELNAAVIWTRAEQPAAPTTCGAPAAISQALPAMYGAGPATTGAQAPTTGAGGVTAGAAQDQHARDSAELRRLCQERDSARRARDLGKVEVAALESSCATLGRVVDELRVKADRYDYLRDRDLSAIKAGGVFAGKTPDNVVLNGEDLDTAIDAALKAAP